MTIINLPTQMVSFSDRKTLLLFSLLTTERERERGRVGYTMSWRVKGESTITIKVSLTHLC